MTTSFNIFLYLCTVPQSRYVAHMIEDHGRAVSVPALHSVGLDFNPTPEERLNVSTFISPLRQMLR